MKRKNAFFLIVLLPLLCILAPGVYSQPSNWQARGAGGGGSMFYPTINPANDNEFYITCDMSQLFHSTDFGVSYTQVPFTQLQTGNISTYEFTSSSGTAYCIANDGNINYGVRSLDGGSTWTALPGNPLAGEDVFALKADYDVPGRIILGYYDALYISNDFGVSFSLIKTAANSGAGITVAGVFFDGNNIYIGTNEGILYSSNGGNSFTKAVTTGMPAAEAIFSFAGAKAGGITRFFCITANASDVYNGIFPWEYYGLAKGIYTLDAGTNVWTARTTGINVSNDFVMYVGMARNDINTVYLGGNDNSTGGNCVIKTTNAGGSWAKVFLTANNQNIKTGWAGQGGDRDWSYGESCFGISVAPNNANKVLFGDYGFIHKTSDGGASWEQAYVNSADEHPAGASTPARKYYHSSGLENTTAWQVHWQDANNMFACFSDIRGIRSIDGGASWGFDYTGHTSNSMYRIAGQATGTSMFAAVSGIHDMYQSTRLQDNPLDNTDAGGRIIYSTDNGAAWQLLHQFNHPVFWVATDPNNQNRMYASVIHYGGGSGQGGIWMTNDLTQLAASSWTKLPNPPRTEGHPACIVVLNDGKMVCTFSGRRNASGFTASSGVFIYDPATGNWADVSHADMQYWTKDLVIDPADPTQNTWWVAVFSGWGGAPNGKGGLFRTTNRGASWTKLTGTQFDRVSSLSFNPAVTNQAYLTTETQGLWISNNMNASTPSWLPVSGYPFRQPERVFFNPYNPAEIWVTSFGNGLKLGMQQITLPLRLVSFAGIRKQGVSHLQWVAADLQSGDQFQVERSADGRHFSGIAAVFGKSSVDNYLLNDTVAGCLFYYRLRITEASHKISYSRVIELKDNEALANDVRLMSNPVRSNIPVQVISTQPGEGWMRLSDLSGKELFRQKINLQPGINQMNLPVPANGSKGIYLLRFSNGNLDKTMRVLLF